MTSSAGSASSSDEEQDDWAVENEQLLTTMYQAFMAMGVAWFGSGFYRTGGYYHFCRFAKSFYTQRHLF